MAEFLGWKPSTTQYFGKGDDSLERLRKPWPADAPWNLVETSYFGFAIPEHNIDCEIYFWAHPVLGVMSGGVFCFQGLKSAQMEADYLQYFNYMPIPDDITDVTYPMGLRVKMIEPFRTFEVSYSDPANETFIEFRSTAIMPAAFRPVGGHFTQAMKNRGKLVLRGREYAIDSYFSRDRSWGDPRPETQLNVTPVGWHVGIFADDLAFHVIAFDGPDSVKSPGASLQGGDASNCIWGYVWRDGRLLGVRRCEKRTFRSGKIFPHRFELRITDEEDQVHELVGTVGARYPFSIWPNSTIGYSFTHWTYKGRAGYGDSQEAYYNRFALDTMKQAAE